jgi:uncharacterized protein YbbC (DUF1343 family)
MYDVMEGAYLAMDSHGHAARIVVLDRPNPLGGMQGMHVCAVKHSSTLDVSFCGAMWCVVLYVI